MFTRQIYDYSAYQQQNCQRKAPGTYSLEPLSTHLGSQTCFQKIPEMHAENKQFKISKPNDMVNIESDLYNLNRPNTKNQYRKFPFIRPSYQNPPGPLSVCDEKVDFKIIYPTLENSQWNREKSIHIPRFESVCLNPQQLNRIRSNNVIGLNTRLYNRDKYGGSCKPCATTNDENVFCA